MKFSVAEKCPDLVNEWHPTKNGMLLPTDITIGSGKKVWWICSKGHEWEAVIANRAKGQRCPYCSGKRLIKGENDLQSKYPDIAKEWDYTKNAPLKPADFMSNTNKTFWWKCSKGHEWEAKANNRVQGKGCPYCAGRRVIVGENDLLTKNPNLAAEWNYEKNYPLRPEDVMAGRNKSAWWKCKHCGFEWEAVINMRNRGAGCPKCARRFHSSFPEQALFFYIHQAYVYFDSHSIFIQTVTNKRHEKKASGACALQRLQIKFLFSYSLLSSQGSSYFRSLNGRSKPLGRT